LSRKLRTRVSAKVPTALTVSIVLPCLNEAATVGKCVKEAKRWLERKRGEVIVVDNGSSDESIAVAKKAGARVVTESKRGYGAAIYRGLVAAKGEYIIIADSDLSYDLRHLTPFLKKLQAGADLVIGNRFKGGVQKGAMPWLHYYIGNPILTWTANLFFGTHLGDYHSGIRALRKSVVKSLNLQCVGMEFASEMIVRAALLHLNIQEVPVVYRKDGRKRKSHIRTFRDGWRHLRFLMLFAPNWIFFFPALIILILSLAVLIFMVLESLELGHISLGIHTMLVLGALLNIGYQLFHWSLCIDVFAKRIHLPVQSPPVVGRFDRTNLEVMMLLGGAICTVGLIFCSWTLLLWSKQGFGDLNPESTMRVFIPGITFVILGIQVFFSTLFLGILNFEHIHKSSS